MKFLLELFPVLIFFIVYKTSDIYIATGALIVTLCLQMGWTWYRNRALQTMQWVTLFLVIIFGGATLLLRDPLFIQWKPTILNYLFALAFAVAGWFTGQPLIKKLLDGRVTLPDQQWQTLNTAWVLFFLFSGTLNLFVVYNFSEAFWVNFKLFGLMGLTFLFVIGQAVYMARFMPDEGEEQDKAS
ncbi:MAG: septation protein A [Magnetococcales bacterium]|nr:septation protein A [Magnetococcales bacterium]